MISFPTIYFILKSYRFINILWPIVLLLCYDIGSWYKLISCLCHVLYIPLSWRFLLNIVLMFTILQSLLMELMLEISRNYTCNGLLMQTKKVHSWDIHTYIYKSLQFVLPMSLLNRVHILAWFWVLKLHIVLECLDPYSHQRVVWG